MLYKTMIKENLMRLSETEKIIGKAIINGDIDIFTDETSKITKQLGVSNASISKFCKKIGATGWKEYKGIALASLSKGMMKTQSSNGIMSRLSFIFSSLENSKTYSIKVNKISKTIRDSNKVLIYANDFTADVAYIFVNKLQKAGYNAEVTNYNSGFRIVNDETTIILLSISGYQTQINKTCNLYKKQKKIYITLGKASSSLPLQLAANIFNKIPYSERVFPLASDVVLLFILNDIFSKTIDKDNVDKFIEKEKLIHHKK